MASGIPSWRSVVFKKSHLGSFAVFKKSQFIFKKSQFDNESPLEVVD